MSDSATPWTVAYQAPPSMGFSRQECWSGLPFPSPGGLPDSGIEPGSPALWADGLPSKPPGKPSEVAQSCPTLCDPMDSSLSGKENKHQHSRLIFKHTIITLILSGQKA